MAATNAFYLLGRIAQNTGDYDNAQFTTSSAPLASGNSANFHLRGGKYGLTLVASTYGTVTLQVLAQDGSTWLNVSSALATNGYSTYDCVEGTYRIALA